MCDRRVLQGWRGGRTWEIGLGTREETDGDGKWRNSAINATTGVGRPGRVVVTCDLMVDG